MFDEDPDPQRDATDESLLASPKDWITEKYSIEQQLCAPRGAIFETRIEASSVLRRIGNDRVAIGNFDAALFAYHRALWHVDFDEAYVQLEMLPEHQRTVYESQTPIRLNIAQCLLKQATDTPVSEAARQLDTTLDFIEKYELEAKWRTKALYWRAKARLAAGIYDDAESDLIQAAQLDPNDKLIRNALSDVRHQRRQLRQHQRALYQGKLSTPLNDQSVHLFRRLWTSCILS